MSFENTALWRNALGSQSDDPHSTARERLRAAYARFWKNASHLADQIARDLPGLTLHNAAHFTALWDRADQIVGPDFRLTPVEAFVFGGAILLHDAGNTSAAFERGLRDIEETPEWRDAIADLTMDVENRLPPREEPIELSPELRSRALFTTLRALHARRAENLGELQICNPITKATFHLIEDDELRTQLGPLIGAIAASHHWNVHELDERFQPRPIGAVAGFPREWTIRPILLACLLRCADAVQIDQSRTPDFLYALLQLRGISEQHWRAQNRLAAPVVDPNDPKALVFRSSRPYLENDADAWWVAHDAIQVAHSELQACSILLGVYPLDAGRPKGDSD